MLFNINGKLKLKEDATISVLDHSFLYGDGVFETMRAYLGKVFMLDEHLRRLFISASRINLKIPVDEDELKARIHKTLKGNRLDEARVRLTVSRGTGPIGLTSECEPNIVIMAEEYQRQKEIYETGVNLITMNVERPLPNVKSCNFLVNILAKQKAANAYDALLINSVNEVAECSSSNIFMVNGKKLITPKDNILEGITRDIVLDVSKEVLEIEERNFELDELHKADECFLTNSIAEIVPVVKIDDVFIANAKPGKHTLGVMNRFRQFRNNKLLLENAD